MISREFLRRVFFRDPAIWVPIATALFFQIITWGFLLWQGARFFGAQAIPLHYTIYFGVDLLGLGFGLFIPAAFGLAAFLVNTAFMLVLYERSQFSGYLLVAGTAFLELVIAIASILLLLLNL